MSDEAAPYYVDMVDQQTIGHQFLLNNFGTDAIPKAGWQVGPSAWTHCRCVTLHRSIRSATPQQWVPCTP